MRKDLIFHGYATMAINTTEAYITVNYATFSTFRIYINIYLCTLKEVPLTSIYLNLNMQFFIDLEINVAIHKSFECFYLIKMHKLKGIPLLTLLNSLLIHSTELLL